MTAKKAHQHKINRKAYRNLLKAAHKKATTMYTREREKKNGLSSPKFCKLIKIEMGTNINSIKITRYVQEGMAGELPKKLGPTV